MASDVPQPNEPTTIVDAAKERVKKPLSEEEKAALAQIKDMGAALLVDTDSDGDGKPDANGLKNLWMKDGKLSSSKMFASLASAVVLLVSTVLVLFHGAQVTASWIHFTVPEVNMEWAALLIGIFHANSHVDTRLKSIAKREEAAAASE